MWERPKEIQNQASEPVLSVCHRGCAEINENRIKINRMVSNFGPKKKILMTQTLSGFALLNDVSFITKTGQFQGFLQ